MLALLLDEQLSPKIAVQLRRKHSGMKAHALTDWRGGDLMGADDAVWMSAATGEGLTVVTYDQRTIRPLLKGWMEQGVDHAGVVFVDEKTIAPSDFGNLVKSLGELWLKERFEIWKNRVVFLGRLR